MPTTIPRKDTSFHSTQESISTAALRRVAQWHLDARWLTDHLLPKKILWVAAWSAYTDLRARNTNITHYKQAAREDYERSLRKLVKMINDSPYISDDERIAIGIVPKYRNRKSPVPDPETYPILRVEHAKVFHIKVHFRDSVADNKAKPRGIHGAEVRWAVLEKKPNEPVNFETFAVATRTPYVIRFDERLRGRTVWVCARWRNNAGKPGPWSEIINTTII